jgi:hypothetical protein
MNGTSSASKSASSSLPRNADGRVGRRAMVHGMAGDVRSRRHDPFRQHSWRSSFLPSLGSCASRVLCRHMSRPFAPIVRRAGALARMPCRSSRCRLSAALATAEALAGPWDRHGLGQGVDVDVSLAPAGFARRRNRADAVLAHVGERHWRAGFAPQDWPLLTSFWHAIAGPGAGTVPEVVSELDGANAPREAGQSTRVSPCYPCMVTPGRACQGNRRGVWTNPRLGPSR